MEAVAHVSLFQGWEDMSGRMEPAGREDILHVRTPSGDRASGLGSMGSGWGLLSSAHWWPGLQDGLQLSTPPHPCSGIACLLISDLLWLNSRVEIPMPNVMGLEVGPLGDAQVTRVELFE